MLLVYENKTDGIAVEWKKTVHFPPHLHEAIEVVYVTNGNIELGVGQELYHMDEGDFAIVFPKISGRNNRGEFHADTGICTDDSCPCFRRNANG